MNTDERRGIRKLPSDEPVPDSEPKRYRDGRGYIRLRWLAGAGCYYEEYEHRIVAGRPPEGYQVHHINGDKSDNRLENLEVITRAEHTRRHQAERPKRGRTITRQRAERRQFNQLRADSIVAAYKSGLNTIEIGEKFGVHPSNVSRLLRRQGTPPRKGKGGAASPNTRSLVHARAEMRCEKCGADVQWVGRHVHHRLPRQIGGTRRDELGSPSNLLLLCVPCHDWIEKNREQAYEAGWLVHQGTNPQMVPIKHWSGRELFLLPDGNYGEEVWAA